MTADNRFERHLSTILEDLYLGPTPTYRDEVMATAVRSRQRPSWTFPGRWLPMADIASRPAFVPRAPWRTIGVALVIIAVLLAAALVYVDTQPTKLPAPFGVARNGLIAYALNGDIYAGDPRAGDVRAIVVGEELDRNPVYSRDGSKLAFFRQVANDTGLFHLAVVERDRGDVRILTEVPLGIPALAEWSPDGTFILINDADGRVIRYDAIGKAAPVVIALASRLRAGAFRPPDGAQVLVERELERGVGLFLIDAAGTGAMTMLVEPEPGTDNGGPNTAAWSPDGRFVALRLATVGTPADDVRMFVIGADGTGLLQLDKEPGYWVDSDVVWSPDSTRIAFNRWQFDETAGTHVVRPIGIIPITGGPVIPVGSAPVSEGALFDFSPDGKSILSVPGTLLSAFTWSDNAVGTVARPELIDVGDGTTRELGWSVGSAASWQRRAQ